MGSELCDRCSVIQFNDRALESFLLEEGGKPVSLSISEAGTGANFDITLDYELLDTLPSLISLQDGADHGCVFCAMLRHEIIQGIPGNFDYHGWICIKMSYRWGIYDFDGLGLSVLVVEWYRVPNMVTIQHPLAPPPSRAPECSIAFTLETDDVSVGSWLQIPRLRKEQVMCDENIQFMKQSIDECISKCAHSKPSSFVPTRLLSIDADPDSNSVQLLIPSEILQYPQTDIQTYKYAALSYCWGSKSEAASQLCTTRASIAARKEAINEISMPPVVRDAIHVCRSLSIKYLWVDALCIVQDDLTDWEKESALMSYIYSRALITICTPNSASCLESFLERDPRHVTIPFSSQLCPTIVGQYRLVASGILNDYRLLGWPALDEDDSVWASRGWTLQESLMSTRKLLFGQSMIHFQCDNFVVSETGYRQPNAQPAIFRVEDSAGNMQPYHFEMWSVQVLESNVRRNYTNAQDRLPGMSGMAKLVSDRFDETYLAGLLKSDFPYALMWSMYELPLDLVGIELQEVVDKLCYPDPYIAPSWSPARLIDAKFRRGLGFRIPLFFRRHISTESVLVEARTEPMGQNPYGIIKHGVVRIRGRLVRPPSDIISLPCSRTLTDLWYLRDERHIIAYFRLDSMPRSKTYRRGELRMLMLMSSKASDSWQATYHNRNRDRFPECPCGMPYAEDMNQAPSLLNMSDPRSDDKSIVPSGTSYSSSGSSRRIPNRNVYGLLLHPSRKADQYVRVGVWASVAGDGAGMKYFERFESAEVEIV